MGRKQRQTSGDPTSPLDPWGGSSSVTTVNPWLVVGFAVGVFALAVAALIIVIAGRGDGRADAPPTTVSSVPVATAVTSVPSTTVTTVPPVSVPSTLPPATQPPTTLAPVSTAPAPRTVVMSDAEALSHLQSIVDSSRPSVEQLLDVWVPQLSAKRPGMDLKGDDRGAWTPADILSDYLAYQDRYRGEGVDVLLLHSGEYNFKSDGYLVTVASLVFATPELANGWCADHGIGPDDCFAKRLSHVDGWQGSVLARK